MHLLMDGHSDNKELLQDEEFLRDLLTHYPGRIGMTRISEPLIIRYTDCPPEEWGISGFVFLAESHIAIHTFVEQNLVNVDVFSCKAFDTDLAAEDLRQRFEFTEWRVARAERNLKRSQRGTENPTRYVYNGQ